MALALRRALADAPRITLRLGHAVTRVEPLKGSGFRLEGRHGGEAFEGRFEQVINASWYERLPLDRPLGIVPPRPWSHRYKFGNRIRVRLPDEAVPSCTSVQGPFGDIVNFGERGMFLSWYPIGRTGMTGDEVPPNWHDAYTQEQRLDVFRRSFAEWVKRCPRLESLEVADEQVIPDGGVIYALGTTDVDDDASKLHDRYEIGIQSAGGYHSLDTGKYTLVPYWGKRVAERVMGL